MPCVPPLSVPLYQPWNSSLSRNNGKRWLQRGDPTDASQIRKSAGAMESTQTYSSTIYRHALFLSFVSWRLMAYQSLPFACGSFIFCFPYKVIYYTWSKQKRSQSQMSYLIITQINSNTSNHQLKQIQLLNQNHFIFLSNLSS